MSDIKKRPFSSPSVLGRSYLEVCFNCFRGPRERLHFRIMAASSENNPRGFQMIQVSFAMGVLASLAVALRFLARWRIRASFALDDCFLIASLFPFYGMLVISRLRTCTFMNTEKREQKAYPEKSLTVAWVCQPRAWMQSRCPEYSRYHESSRTVSRGTPS